MVTYFFNPNVHPLSEFGRRLDSFTAYVGRSGIPAIVDSSYPLQEFLRGALEAEAEGETRCRFCYRMRLGKAAMDAARLGFDAFSTTLLASPYQRRELLVQAGEQAAEDAGVSFASLDFRDGWKAGREAARREGLYLQRYCGCILSEQEADAARCQKRTGMQDGKS